MVVGAGLAAAVPEPEAAVAGEGDVARVGEGELDGRVLIDNAMCESLIGTMKIERLNRQPWRSAPGIREPTQRRTHDHQPLACPRKRGKLT